MDLVIIIYVFNSFPYPVFKQFELVTSVRELRHKFIFFAFYKRERNSDHVSFISGSEIFYT
jgi:hypothetical protein